MRTKTLLFLVALALLVGSCDLFIPDGDGPLYNSAPHHNEKGFTTFSTLQTVDLARLPAATTTVLNLTDGMGDDTGAGGVVTYPIGWGFSGSTTGNTYRFNDIHHLVITVDANNLYFDMAMANISMVNEWEDPDDDKLYTADHCFYAIYMIKQGAAATVNHFVTYSPNDGNGDTDNAANPSGKYGLNIAAGWTHTIQALGLGGHVSAGTGLARNAFTRLNDTKLQLLDNDPALASTAVGGLFHSSQVRLTVPRASTGGTTWLTSGIWRLVICTWDWEDYGQAESFPGVNGYPRPLRTTAGIWNYGGIDVTTGKPKVKDIVGANELATNQAAFLDNTSCTLTTDNFLTITIP